MSENGDFFLGVPFAEKMRLSAGPQAMSRGEE